jgi:hypothetical protein
LCWRASKFAGQTEFAHPTRRLSESKPLSAEVKQTLVTASLDTLSMTPPCAAGAALWRGLGWAAAERAKGVVVPEGDGYIAGVPCWVDTSQPDADAAAAFYGGLFGWEFEDAMPSGSEGRYLIARLRSGDVAAVSSQPLSRSTSRPP